MTGDLDGAVKELRVENQAQRHRIDALEDPANLGNVKPTHQEVTDEQNDNSTRGSIRNEKPFRS